MQRVEEVGGREEEEAKFQICFGLNGNHMTEQLDLTVVRQEHHDHDTWYTETRRLPGTNTKVRVVCSTECAGFVTNAHTGRTCMHCQTLWKANSQFRNVLRRLHDKAKSRGGTRNRTHVSTMTREDLLAALILLMHKIARTARLMVLRASASIAMCGLRQRNPCDQMSEFVRRGDMKGILSSLKIFRDQAVTSGQKTGVAMEIVMLMLQNICLPDTNKRKGRKISPAAMTLLSAIRISGGERNYNLLRANTGLPHERNVRKYISSATLNFLEGMNEGNFIIAAELYKNHMEEHNIPLGSVPVMFAEDETAIVPDWWWDVTNDIFGGTCGPLCANKCATIPECRANGCIDPHSCSPLRPVQMVIGNTMESHANMLKFAADHRCCSHMRVIIINPLHEGMPRIPILIQGTCLTFNTDDYVLPQWDQLAVWYKKHLRHVVGPRIGESSDGDPRRRKAFWRASMRGGDLPRQGQLTVDVAGFTMKGIEVNGQTTLRMDQDYIHNLKKLINVLNNASRTVTLCSHPMTLAALEVIKTQFPNLASHGLLSDDLIRSGPMAMDVPSAVRLTSQKFLRCLKTLKDGDHLHEKLPYMEGYLLYFGMCRSTSVFS